MSNSQSTSSGSRRLGLVVEALSALGLVILAAAAPASAVVVCVPNDAIDGSCTGGFGSATIAGGIALANPGGGDTVLVAPGTYVENVNINRNVTLV